MAHRPGDCDIYQEPPGIGALCRMSRDREMPRGVPHTFRVVGDREARILLIHDNASFRIAANDETSEWSSGEFTLWAVRLRASP
jgi:hypothetical protein